MPTSMLYDCFFCSCNHPKKPKLRSTVFKSRMQYGSVAHLNPKKIKYRATGAEFSWYWKVVEVPKGV